MLGSARVVDLSYTLTPEFPLFPAYDPVEVRRRYGVQEDGFYCQAWSFDEHCGTHVDAPAHFGGDTTIEHIDPADLVLPAAVMDLGDRRGEDPDWVVTPDDLLRWERDHGPLPDRCVLLASTGWAAKAHEGEDAYFGFDASRTAHHPGFGEELVQWLAAERPGVRGIGLDTASLDRGASQAFEAHTAWLPTGRYGIENLTNLDRLPPTGAWVVVGAPKLQAGSGGPSRILALVP